MCGNDIRWIRYDSPAYLFHLEILELIRSQTEVEVNENQKQLQVIFSFIEFKSNQNH